MEYIPVQQLAAWIIQPTSELFMSIRFKQCRDTSDPWDL